MQMWYIGGLLMFVGVLDFEEENDYQGYGNLCGHGVANKLWKK